jgi:hypothetical protein
VTTTSGVDVTLCRSSTALSKLPYTRNPEGLKTNHWTRRTTIACWWQVVPSIGCLVNESRRGGRFATLARVCHCDAANATDTTAAREVTRCDLDSSIVCVDAHSTTLCAKLSPVTSSGVVIHNAVENNLIACPRRALCKATWHPVHPCHNPQDIDIACPHHALRKTDSNPEHSCHNPRDSDIACPRRALYKT